jgi:hypothetical protein
MKTRLTLIIINQDITKPFDSDDYFKFFLTKDLMFPSQYISTKDEKAVQKELFEKYIAIPYEWANLDLCDFRKRTVDECEVVYSCKINNILDVEKNGRFVSLNEKISIDDFYGRILSTRFRAF